MVNIYALGFITLANFENVNFQTSKELNSTNVRLAKQ